MVRDLWAADPTAQLRIAFAEFTADPVTVEPEDSDLVAERHSYVAVAVLLVQCSGERMNDAGAHFVPRLTSTG